DFPVVEKARIDKDLEEQMGLTREIVEACLSARSEAKIKLRWPIDELVVVTEDLNSERAVSDLSHVIISQAKCKAAVLVDKNDVRLKEMIGVKFSKGVVYVPKKLSPELFSEAMSREVIRRLQGARKELKLQENSRIKAEVVADAKFLDLVKGFKDLIESETRCEDLSLTKSASLKGDFEKEFKVEDFSFKISVSKP
ncbi:MAG: hypothetical protein GOV15_03595, partial [Candidatus Diapherotrites archaeon]|nr:hypothetical protein [Candidatus Diapherotrites archaeon]